VFRVVLVKARPLFAAAGLPVTATVPTCRDPFGLTGRSAPRNGRALL
jgi:hypothetical protein